MAPLKITLDQPTNYIIFQFKQPDHKDISECYRTRIHLSCYNSRVSKKKMLIAQFDKRFHKRHQTAKNLLKYL